MNSFETAVVEAMKRRKAGYAARQLRKVFAVAATLTFPDVDSACRPGCHACCWTMPVVHSTIEAMAIKRAVMENDRGARTFLRNISLRPMVKLLREISNITCQASWSELVRAEWETTELPCPALLLPKGECVLWNCRPLECHLRTSPVPCERPFNLGAWGASAIPPLMLATMALNENDYEGNMADPNVSLKARAAFAAKGVIDTCWSMDKALFGAPGSPRLLAEILDEAIRGK